MSELIPWAPVALSAAGALAAMAVPSADRLALLRVAWWGAAAIAWLAPAGAAGPVPEALVLTVAALGSLAWAGEGERLGVAAVAVAAWTLALRVSPGLQPLEETLGPIGAQLAVLAAIGVWAGVAVAPLLRGAASPAPAFTTVLSAVGGTGLLAVVLASGFGSAAARGPAGWGGLLVVVGLGLVCFAAARAAWAASLEALACDGLLVHLGWGVLALAADSGPPEDLPGLLVRVSAAAVVAWGLLRWASLASAGVLRGGARGLAMLILVGLPPAPGFVARWELLLATASSPYAGLLLAAVMLSVALLGLACLRVLQTWLAPGVGSAPAP